MEIRKLTVKDEPSLERLMSPHTGYNIFILGNLVTRGWQSPDLEYWGAFAQERLEAVLMRYRDNWAAWWDTPGQFIAKFAETISSHSRSNITGHPHILDMLYQQGLEVKKRYEQHLAILDKLIMPEPTCAVRWAEPEEVNAVLELYAGDEIPRTREGILRRITGGGLALGISEEKLVTSAAVTAYSRDCAMLGGVWTPPQYRNRGYASWCTAWLCQRLLERGLTPALFYHNLAAGRIYQRMGFREIGPYAMFSLA